MERIRQTSFGSDNEPTFRLGVFMVCRVGVRVVGWQNFRFAMNRLRRRRNDVDGAIIGDILPRSSLDGLGGLVLSRRPLFDVLYAGMVAIIEFLWIKFDRNEFVLSKIQDRTVGFSSIRLHPRRIGFGAFKRRQIDGGQVVAQKVILKTLSSHKTRVFVGFGFFLAPLGFIGVKPAVDGGAKNQDDEDGFPFGF